MEILDTRQGASMQALRTKKASAEAVVLLPFALLLLLLAGCGSRASGVADSRAGPGEGAVERIEMEPMQILAERRDGVLRLLHRDAATLFRRASEAYESGDHSLAIDLYCLLIQEFPRSRYIMASRYNLGLALEEEGRHAEAYGQYRRIVADGPGSQDALDARFRIARCQRELADPAAAVATLRELLAMRSLSRQDRLMATVRLGDALLAAGELDQAERTFRKILVRPRLKGRPTPLPVSGKLLAEAQFGIARVSHERFRQVQIRLPDELMEKDIADKARTFLRAQAGYLRTIRLKVAKLVTASGLQIGTLYEEFYEDLIKAPVPEDLSEEEVEVYFEELRKVIRPLVKQAIHVYERNLLYAERFRAGNNWVAQTESRLARLQSFLEGDARAEPGATFERPETDPEPPEFVGPCAP